MSVSSYETVLATGSPGTMSLYDTVLMRLHVMDIDV